MATEKTPKKIKAPTAVEELRDADVHEPLMRNGDNLDDEASVEEAVREADEAMEVLEPKAEAKRWVVGKPPEEGGKETQFSVYVQQPLGFMARNRLYALIGRTMSAAIKATGGSVGGMDDIFGSTGGTIRERTQRLGQQDFQDASQFFTLAMELIGYNPDFLGEFYAIVLEVPYGERVWFKEVIEQPYRPEEDKWGLSEDNGLEMIAIFIDQNYEEVRRFFAEKLPMIAKRVTQREQDRQKTLPKSA